MHIPFTDYQRGVISADVNGDGRSDLVYQQSGHVRALINPAEQGRWQRITLHSFAADDVLNLRLFDEAKDTTAAFDVNGDGRTDFVFELQKREYYCIFSGPIFNPRSLPRPLVEPAISVMRTEFDDFAPAEPGLDNSGQFECMRRGGRWVSQRYTTQEMFVSSGDMATPRLTATGTLGTASTEQMRPVDINGDGLSDIMYTLNGMWFYRISTGTYFRQGQSTGLRASDALNHRTHFVDINGDGRTDILHASRETQLDIYMSSPIDGVSDRVTFSRTGTRHVSANARIHLGLLNRDNHIDVLTYQRGTWSVYWGQQHPAVDTIHTITNGFGVSTEIDYRAQSDPAVYTLTLPRHSLPEQVIAPGRGPNLVYQVHTDSNVNTGNHTKQRVSVRYHYRDALLHIAGRGVLGFGELQTQDRQTGVITTTQYHQDASGQQYALIGMPLATTQTLNGKVLSTSTNTLAVKTTAMGSLFPYIASSTDSIIHVDDDAQAVHEVGAIHATYEYDDYGNLTYSKTEQQDRRSSGYTPYIRTETTNTYGSDERMQRLGRLTKTHVTHSSNVAGTNKRQSVFTYQANGLLQSSTVYGDSETGNVASDDPRYVGHHLKTLYAYDSYGQQTAQCTTDDITQTQVPDASSQSGARCARTEYSDDGRVISATINSLGERTTLDYDASHGQHLGIIYQVTTTTENGISTRAHLDGFGRQVAMTLPNGVIQRTSMGFTSSYAAHFYEQRTQPGQAPVTVYYDAWGRERAMVTRKRSYEDAYQDVVVYTTYDSQGRRASVSQPNDETAVTTTQYDALGRVLSVTRPGTEVERVSRVNGAIITTNALGHQHTERYNPFGQLASTRDNLGNELYYTYDVMGNLTYTRNSFNAQVIVNTYDSWGRKVRTDDPDMGSWHYHYNHYGELIEQTDAMGHRFVFDYDALGRMLRRYSPDDGTSCWQYGSTEQRHAHASGKLLHKAVYAARDVVCSKPQASPDSQTYYTYDEQGRVSTISRLVKGQRFTETMGYNALGQLSEVTYPTGTSAFTVKHEYDDVGEVRRLRHVQSDTVLWQAALLNDSGLLAQATFGNGLSTDYGYTIEGMLDSVSTAHQHNVLHHSRVILDEVGNVTERRSAYQAQSGIYKGLVDTFTETYTYDSLNRLSARQYTASQSGITPSQFQTQVTYAYDDAGNLTYKSDAGTYLYDRNIPNRLMQVTNARNQVIKAFDYDDNGNIIAQTHVKGFAYTAFNKPYRISHRNGAVVDMAYDIDRNMVFKRDTRYVSGKHTVTEHYYAGAYEKIMHQHGRSKDMVEHKYHLMGGSIVITARSNGTTDTYYLHKDTQGSVSLITNASGHVVAQYLYDPFGKQTTLTRHWLFAQGIYQSPTHQGYTEHHELSDVGVVHMGGRIYDASLGRFLQADPHIQASDNTQNYNRYSYVLNNPMSYTDPSGYFFKSLFKKLNKALGKFAPVFGIAMMMIPGMQAWAAQSIWHAAAVGFGIGGVSTGSLKGALIGAFIGAAFHQIGSHFNNLHDDNLRAAIGGSPDKLYNFGGNLLTSGQVTQQIAAHAVVGGVAAELAGGKFGHGFISAGVTKGAGGTFLKGGTNLSSGDIAKGTFISAAIGGTVSKLTGGKFANGASTGAFQYLFNQVTKSFRENALKTKREFHKITLRGKEIEVLHDTLLDYYRHGETILTQKCSFYLDCVNNLELTLKAAEDAGALKIPEIEITRKLKIPLFPINLIRDVTPQVICHNYTVLRCNGG
jgi:RHS repeat-associated protein